MDPLWDFIRFAVRREFTTPGGWLNFVFIAVLALLVNGADVKTVLFQTYESGFRVLDRCFHFLEEVLEFLAALMRAPFRASERTDPYQAPSSSSDWRLSLGLGLLFLLCVLAVGAEGYS